jgi:hypothetical protein
VWWLSCLQFDPRFASSNPIQEDGFLREIKILSTTFFIGEAVFPSPCRNILHVKEPCGIKKRFRWKVHRHFSPSFSWFATRCLCWLIPESMNQGWLELRWGRTVDQIMVAVHGPLYDTTAYSNHLWNTAKFSRYKFKNMWLLSLFEPRTPSLSQPNHFGWSAVSNSWEGSLRGYWINTAVGNSLTEKTASSQHGLRAVGLVYVLSRICLF